MRNGAWLHQAYQDYVVVVDFKAFEGAASGASVPSAQARCRPSGALADAVGLRIPERLIPRPPAATSRRASGLDLPRRVRAGAAHAGARLISSTESIFAQLLSIHAVVGDLLRTLS